MFQVTTCQHAFCKACLTDFSASFGQVSCPTCSKVLTVDFTTNLDAANQTTKTTIKGFRSSSIMNRIQLDNFQTSTKIEALVRHLIHIIITIFLFFNHCYAGDKATEIGIICDHGVHQCC